MNEGSAAKQGSLRRSFVRWFLRQAERLLAVVGASFLLYNLTMNVSVMTSESMAPALKGTSRANGDWVLTERVSYWFRRPQRWEIVTFRNSEGLQVMKRVAGLPAESVSLKERTLHINGEPIVAPQEVQAVKYLAYGNLLRGKPCPCGNGYYVLGDDSADSEDSRFEGPVAKGQIVGRAWMIVWPLSRVRFLTPR